jgi:hypothetical protein
MGRFEIIAGLLLAAILFIVLKVRVLSRGFAARSGASFSNSLRS